MKIRVLALGAAALVLPFTSACGSDSGGSSVKTTTTTATSTTKATSSGTGSSSGKPAAAKISAALTSGLGVAQDAADCAADKLLAGDFSDEAFKAMANGKRDELPAAETDAVVLAIQKAVEECNAGS